MILLVALLAQGTFVILKNQISFLA